MRVLLFPGQAGSSPWGLPPLRHLTNEVRRVLVEERPEVAIVAAGAAQLDVGKPLPMTLADLLEFVELAPGMVVANHPGVSEPLPNDQRQASSGSPAAGALPQGGNPP